MKEDKIKDGTIDLDFMLYRHVKEIISNYTIYLLCAEDSIDSKYVKSEICTDTIIGVMVIEKNDNDKSKVYSGIHYMCILPKWRRRAYGTYLMGKIFACDSELENVKLYTVTRLIHDYTPSHYIEPVSKYTNRELDDIICEDITNYYKKKVIRIPQFGKHLNHIFY